MDRAASWCGGALACAALGLLGLVLLGSHPASALGFSLQVYADGVRIDDGNVDETRLGCVPDASGASSICNVQNLDYGAADPSLRIELNDFYVDGDPVVNGNTNLTNLLSSTQHYTLLFTLPVASMPGGTLTGGRIISAMLTDNNGDGATLSASTGSAIYTALLDGANWQTLYADPTSFSAVANGSTAIPQAIFGDPIPSLPGPAVASTIGIRLDFDLTGFDSLSLTSEFNVVPVPEPGTAALLGLGLAFLARGRRR